MESFCVVLFSAFCLAVGVDGRAMRTRLQVGGLAYSECFFALCLALELCLLGDPPLAVGAARGSPLRLAQIPGEFSCVRSWGPPTRGGCSPGLSLEAGTDLWEVQSWGPPARRVRSQGLALDAGTDPWDVQLLTVLVTSRSPCVEPRALSLLLVPTLLSSLLRWLDLQLPGNMLHELEP